MKRSKDTYGEAMDMLIPFKEARAEMVIVPCME
jgi:hypothetical protein